MYIKRPGPANYTKPVDLRTLYAGPASGADEHAPTALAAPEGVLESVGETFSRHVMHHGTVTMTGMGRLERDAARYGGYRRIDGIERHHHPARPDIP